MQQQQGPCVCGKSLGKHTKRAARRHRDAWDGFESLTMWADLLEGFATIFGVIHRGEVEQLTEGFTEAIRAASKQP